MTRIEVLASPGNRTSVSSNVALVQGGGPISFFFFSEFTKEVVIRVLME